MPFLINLPSYNWMNTFCLFYSALFLILEVKQLDLMFESFVGVGETEV